MPILKQLTCRVEFGQQNTRLSEYGTEYGDGIVNTYVAIPSNSETFTIHVTSSGYIGPGLAIFVFIDGKHQCNRNRSGLIIPDMNTHPSLYEIDFRVRQKEEKFADQHFLGLANPAEHNTQTDEDVLAGIGTIEVLVLRCFGGGPNNVLGIDDGGDLDLEGCVDIVGKTRVPAPVYHGFTSLNLDGPCEREDEVRGRNRSNRHVQFAGPSYTPAPGTNQRLRSPPPPAPARSYVDLHRGDERPPTRRSGGHGLGDLGQSAPWHQSSYQLPLPPEGDSFYSSGGGDGYSLIARPAPAAQPGRHLHRHLGGYYDYAPSSYRRQDALPQTHERPTIGQSFQSYWENEQNNPDATDPYGWPLKQDDGMSTRSSGTAGSRSSGGSTIKASRFNRANDAADFRDWTGNNSTENLQNAWGSNDNAATGWSPNDNAATAWGSNDNAATGWGPNDNAATGWVSNDNAATAWGSNDNAQETPNSEWVNDAPYVYPSKRRKRERASSAPPTSTPAEITMTDADAPSNIGNSNRARIQPYWARWYNQPHVGLPAAESGRNPYIVPAEPPVVVPQSLAQERSISHQVHIGQARMYQHLTARPVYIDSMLEPYAVFVFNYRTRDELQAMLPGYKIKEDRPSFRDRMQDLPRDEIMDMLVQAKAQAGYATDSSVSNAPANDPDVAMGQADEARQEQDPMSDAPGGWS